MNDAAYVYAGYLISRNLALAIVLLVLLAMGAKRMLAGVMVLVALIQLIDAVVDVTTGRAALLPVILLLGAAFLIGASRLLNQPFWNVAAWRDSALSP